MKLDGWFPVSIRYTASSQPLYLRGFFSGVLSALGVLLCTVAILAFMALAFAGCSSDGPGLYAFDSGIDSRVDIGVLSDHKLTVDREPLTDLPGAPDGGGAADLYLQHDASEDGPTPLDLAPRPDAPLAPDLGPPPPDAFVHLDILPSDGLRNGNSWVYVPPQSGQLGFNATDPGESWHWSASVGGLLMQRWPVVEGVFAVLMNYDPTADWAPYYVDRYRIAEHISEWDAWALCNALSREHGLPECYRCEGADPHWDEPDWHLKGEPPSLCWHPRGYQAEFWGCKGYRLPTTAEWELAYRAGTTSNYYDGADQYQYPWNSVPKCNALGICGMVARWHTEWTADAHWGPEAPPGAGGGPLVNPWFPGNTGDLVVTKGVIAGVNTPVPGGQDVPPINTTAFRCVRRIP